MSDETKTCAYCGRKVARLVPVSADDIQRKHPPRVPAWDFACEDCHPKIRDIARLVPEYSLARALRYLSTRIPILTVCLALVTILVAALTRGIMVGGWPPSILVGITATAMGLQMMWSVLKDRYGSTHDLRWSLNSRFVVRGVGNSFFGVVSFDTYSLPLDLNFGQCFLWSGKDQR